MNETLEGIARALFKSWFIDFDPVRAKAEGRQPFGMDQETAALFPDQFEDSELGEIPKGWAIEHLAEVIDLNPSTPLKKGECAPYVDMGELPTRGLRIHSWFSRPFGSGSKFVNGDTLLARITPCLENGKTAYVDILIDGETGWGSTEFVVLRSKGKIPPTFVYLLARHDIFRNYAIQSMSGTSGRQRVQISSLADYCVVIPNKCEILDLFSKQVKPIFDDIKLKDEETSILIGLRDQLIPKLISGDIRVDPTKFGYNYELVPEGAGV